MSKEIDYSKHVGEIARTRDGRKAFIALRLGQSDGIEGMIENEQYPFVWHKFG